MRFTGSSLCRGLLECSPASEYFGSDGPVQIELCWVPVHRLIRDLSSELNGKIDDPQIIMSEIKIFYGKLHKKTSVKTEEKYLQYLSNLNTPVLFEDEKSLRDGKLTLKECWDALNSVKNETRPGNDVFTKDLYVAFFGELGPLLSKTFNYSFEKGKLSASQKQAVITLIYKNERCYID